MKANLENSPGILHTLIEKFATIRDAWYRADRGLLSPPSTPTPAGLPDAPSSSLKSTPGWQAG